MWLMYGEPIDQPADVIAHHLPDEPVEGLDAAPRLRAAEQPRSSAAAAADVERSQVGEGTPTLVGVLDALAARAGCGRERLVAALPGLDRGFLVGADHE